MFSNAIRKKITMLDFRLKVFHTVARRLNFTKAAEELFITQPAVSRHIQEIENHYKCKLFERNGTRIQLTSAGELLFKHTEELFNLHRDIELEMAAVNAEQRGNFRLGASTTIAQYFVPKYLAMFKQKFPGITLTMSTGNTENIENLLSEHKIDLGIVEGQSKRPQLKYIPLIKDEIVLCTGAKNKTVVRQEIPAKDLSKLPLVLRETGSGTLEVVNSALRKAETKLSDFNVEMVFENTESIKSYIIHSNTFAFLSIHSIEKELLNGSLKIIDIKNLPIERYFYFITQQGDVHQLSNLFMNFMQSYNFRL